MGEVNIYVHGTPNGHKVWGSEANQDYIDTFYSTDAQYYGDAVLQIEVCAGTSFYTYLRRGRRIIDIEGRPDRFFAITVAFQGKSCSNVCVLYQLMDQVYQQFCENTILRSEDGTSKYLVGDFKEARKGSHAVVDIIKAGLIQNIEKLISPRLQPLEAGNTFNRSREIISLQDVNSPYYDALFSQHSLIVSPDIPAAQASVDKLKEMNQQIESKKTALAAVNGELQSEVTELNRSIAELKEKLTATLAESSSKNSGWVSKLEAVSRERDVYKSKLEKARLSVEALNLPLNKLTQAVGGIEAGKGEEDVLKEQKKAPFEWREWTHTFLLGVIVLLCVLILLMPKIGKEEKAVQNPDTIEDVHTDSAALAESDLHGPEATVEDNFEWDLVRIDIRNGGDKVSKGQSYDLQLRYKNNSTEEEIPSGEWRVVAGDGTVVSENPLSIPSQLPAGSELEIQYVVNDSPVVKRTITVR